MSDYEHGTVEPAWDISIEYLQNSRSDELLIDAS